MITYTYSQIKLLIQIKNNSCLDMECTSCPLKDACNYEPGKLQGLEYWYNIEHQSKARAADILRAIITQK